MVNKASFTSASTIPSKLFCDMEMLSDISLRRYIRPVHIQINPTNNCPLNCSFCLKGDTMILTPNGSLPIEDLKVGDEVISGNKKIRKVKKIFKRFVDTLLKIDLKYLPTLYVTEEHPFLIKGCQIKAKDLKPGMELEVVKSVINYRAADIKRNKGRPKEILYLSKLFNNSEKRYHSKIRFSKKCDEIGRFRLKGSKYSCPQKIDLNYEFGRFCGLYLAEGHIGSHRDRPNSKYICLSFGKHEKDLVQFIRDFCDKHGFKYADKIYRDKTSWQVTIYNSILSGIIEKFLGTEGSNKKIPFNLNFNYNYAKGLIRGLWDGDACKKFYKLHISNKKLLFDVYQMLLGYGFMLSYEEKKGKPSSIEGRSFIEQDSFSLTIATKFRRGFDLFLTENVKHYDHMRVTEYTSKIKSIKKINEKTPVYNISVDTDETYYSNFILSHNCSVKNRDKSIEMDFQELIDITEKFRKLGTKAVTITGGGDPLAYPRLNEYVTYLSDHKIKAGLVTNGVLLKESDKSFLSKLTWCRVSLSDEYTLLTPKLEDIVKSCKIDWSFSYVIKADVKIERVVDAIDFANKYGFTHVRLVSDILNEQDSYDMGFLKRVIRSHVDDSRVIYQGRKLYSPGHKRCLISLLKPNIGPDGNIYGCCGIQYAKNPPSLDFNPKDSMGSVREIDSIWDNQRYYDGSLCEKCYYSDYNNILNIVWDSNNLEHKEFI